MKTLSPLKFLLLFASVGSGIALISQVPFHNFDRNNLTDRFRNPFALEIETFAAQRGLDLSFTSIVQDMYTFPISQRQLFCLPPKTLDLLIVGDSVAGSGIVPEMIEQMTGLKTRSFTLEMLFLNQRNLNYVKQVADYVLKPDGKLIFIFAAWTQQKEPDLMATLFLGHEADEHSRFVSAIQNANELCPKSSHFFSKQSYDHHQRILGRVDSFLREKGGLKLPNIDLYERWIEPRVNPKWSLNKSTPYPIGYLRWNEYSVLWHKPQLIDREEYAKLARNPFKVSQIPSVTLTAQTLANLNALARMFPGSIYVVPPTPPIAPPLQRLYYHKSDLRRRLMLMDLAYATPEKTDWNQDGFHMVNMSIFHMTEMAGKWLKKNHPALRRP